jgi:predicted TIM-barrel fold metal-dependent hydrolase
LPDPSDTFLYRPWLPQQLRALAEPLGVRGAIAIEWSSWTADNQWLLDLADADPFVIGVVGNLEAGEPGFEERLERYAAHARFVGIRVGTPWCPLALANPQLIDDLRALAAAGLAMDAVTVGGGGLMLLDALLVLTDRVPALRVVVDHLPFAVPSDAHVRYTSALRELAGRPNVFVKISNVLPRTGAVPTDPAFYKPIVDEVVDAFGTDRIIYASNWPVSTRVAPYERALGVLRRYFDGCAPGVAEKFFGANALAAYRRG